MAQMFSSGVTPDYLQTLADAYAQYFPQQAPVNTQALQQWYSPNGSSAFAAPMGASAAPSSVVGSLFGEQYPQTRQGSSGSMQLGGGQEGYAPSTQTLGAGLASAGINYGNLLGGMLPYGALAGMLGNAYKESQLSNAALNGGYTGTYTGYAAFGDRPNNLAVEGALGPLSGAAFGEGPSGTRGSDGGGGAATGGNGGDASGGGDRGTRGGF